MAQYEDQRAQHAADGDDNQPRSDRERYLLTLLLASHSIRVENKETPLSPRAR